MESVEAFMRRYASDYELQVADPGSKYKRI
jgi:hypothetical protein